MQDFYIEYYVIRFHFQVPLSYCSDTYSFIHSFRNLCTHYCFTVNADAMMSRLPVSGLDGAEYLERIWTQALCQHGGI